MKKVVFPPPGKRKRVNAPKREIQFNCTRHRLLIYAATRCNMCTVPAFVVYNYTVLRSISGNRGHTLALCCFNGIMRCSIIRKGCQKVKQVKKIKNKKLRPITGSSTNMHTWLTACNKLKMTLYVFSALTKLTHP